MRNLILASYALLTVNICFCQTLKFKEELFLWPNGAPGSSQVNYPWPDYHEKWIKDSATSNDLVKWITHPTIRIFKPRKPNGTAMVICPGGGYNIIEIEKEGYQIARKLNEFGITVFVLKYRHYDKYAALQDAHRAIRWIRFHSGDFGISPEKVGIGGFSAGGHLSLHSATNLLRPEEWQKDAVDSMDNTPNFLMLIYPSTKLPAEAVVDSTMPPCFIAISQQDFLIDPALTFYEKIRKLNIPSEIHIFQAGKHGFGTGEKSLSLSIWPLLFKSWLIENDFFAY